jgi:hypothetical protein
MILKQTIRRELYIAGESGSASELVRFMICKSETDIENIAIKNLLIAAIQANQTVSEWKVSSLENHDIDVSSVDLSQLLGGKYFTISYKLLYNKYII